MKRILSCLCIITINFPCTNPDNSNNQSNQSEVNFYTLTVGKFWMYKKYRYNQSTETYNDTGLIGSVGIFGIQKFPGLDHFYYASGYGLIYNTSSFANSNTPNII